MKINVLIAAAMSVAATTTGCQAMRTQSGSAELKAGTSASGVTIYADTSAIRQIVHMATRLELEEPEIIVAAGDSHPRTITITARRAEISSLVESSTDTESATGLAAATEYADTLSTSTHSESHTDISPRSLYGFAWILLFVAAAWLLGRIKK